MQKGNTYLAIDFGASNGRVIVGQINYGKLNLIEIHRFENKQIKLGKHIYWDFLYLFDQMKKGIALATKKGYNIKSIGINTWGVDFGLIDKKGNFIGNPICYRDSRTNGIMENVFEKIDRGSHYSKIGINSMEINTLFQLFSMYQNVAPQLEIADKLLFMPDLFVYFLTGVANNEYSIASTSELIDAKSQNWSFDLIEKIGIRKELFCKIIHPYSIRGTIKQDICNELGLANDTVVATIPSHDTACAAMAIPSTNTQKTFISSGTWSLLGAVIKAPILSKEANSAGFSNEGGANGYRFLQNITGMWILQRLIANWKENGYHKSYEDLISDAERCDFSTIINVDDPTFKNPDSMETAILDYCVKNKLIAPKSKNEFVKCVCLSLAHRYKTAINDLNKLIEKNISELHIIGGGSQNKLLNQLTANTLNICIKSGPVEASATGNILSQARSNGDIANNIAMQKLLLNSIEITEYYPKN